MKYLKRSLFFGIVGTLISIFIFGCSDSNKLNGTWEGYTGDFRKFYTSYGYPFQDISFSGKNFTTNNNRYKGTYSISDNQMEIVFSDGNITVVSFSRTENTITIDGRGFRRKQ